MEKNKGTLYICPTPIGNLEDMTYRVERVLNEVDIIACEDTRHTLKLLNHFNIKKSLVSYHEHNKNESGLDLIMKLKSGQNIALVTDAGTPCISDPGEDLVRLCKKENIDIVSIPGPSALITGLTLSGMNTRRFTFEGFLPVKSKDRKKHFELIENETRTMVFYEAPHKLMLTLNDMYSLFGNRSICICRELTKKYEEVINSDIKSAIDYFSKKTIKGEFVLIVEGKDNKEIEMEEARKWDEMPIVNHIKYYEEKGYTNKDALKLVAKDRRISKREVYSMQLELKK